MDLSTIDWKLVITVVIYIIGFIIGYTKLNSKTDYNTELIKLINIRCLKCKDNMERKIDTKFDKLASLIQLIKKLVSLIASLIAKLNGMISIYISTNKQDRN